MLGRLACLAALTLAACAQDGKAADADAQRDDDARCSDLCPSGTCDNLGHSTSIHDVPCTPNHAAKLGERCSKDKNCADGLHCTDHGGWRGTCKNDWSAPHPSHRAD